MHIDGKNGKLFLVDLSSVFSFCFFVVEKISTILVMDLVPEIIQKLKQLETSLPIIFQSF